MIAFDLRTRAPLRRRRRATGSTAACRPIVTMATRAMLQIQPASAAAGVARRQASGPRDVVGVDVEHSGRRIDRRPSPLGAPVETREDDRLTSDGERHKEPAVLERPQLLDGPPVRLWRACGQHALVQHLPRKRLRGHRNRLSVGRHLTWDGARRELPVIDRKERLAVGPIEHEDIAMLRRLDDGVHRAAVAP